MLYFCFNIEIVFVVRDEFNFGLVKSFYYVVVVGYGDVFFGGV